MLKIFSSPYGLDFSRLQQVYSENPDAFFYEDTLDFLSENGCMYAVWSENDVYLSALRWQPFLDGFLIAGIETRPDERRKGYAQQLLRAVLMHFQADRNRNVYSHIERHNEASIGLHHNLGFEKVMDCGHLLDGSVSREFKTFKIKI